MSADGNTKRPPRPCNEYNLFSQLERAYILQVHLQVQPSPEDSLEVFHPSQPTYAGLPHLPSRYASLTLPYDWHLPGKEQRRQRKHRRSHGVISFQDLSLRIAEAWKKCDDVAIREYCAEVCKVGHLRYRKELMEWKASNQNSQEDGEKKKTEKKEKLSANKNKKQGRSGGPELAEMEDSLRPLAKKVRRMSGVSPSPSNVAVGSAQALKRGVAPELDIKEKEMLDMLLDQHHQQDEEVEPALHLNMVRRASVVSLLDEQPLQERRPSLISNVDMDDDEIISMWKTSGVDPVPALVSRAPQALISNTSSNITYASNSNLSSTNASNLSYHHQTFGPNGYSSNMLEEVRKMALLLEQQRVQLSELAKHTIDVHSA